MAIDNIAFFNSGCIQWERLVALRPAFFYDFFSLLTGIACTFAASIDRVT